MRTSLHNYHIPEVPRRVVGVGESVSSSHVSDASQAPRPCKGDKKMTQQLPPYVPPKEVYRQVTIPDWNGEPVLLRVCFYVYDDDSIGSQVAREWVA